MLIGNILNGLREGFRRGFFAGVSGPRGGLPDVGYKSGSYYDGLFGGAFNSSSALGGGNAGIIPFVSRAAQTFDRITLYNTGAGDSGDKIRFFIVQDNGGTPIGGTILANPAEITLSGATVDNAATISLSLAKGQLVWLGVVANAAITTQNVAPSVGDLAWSSLIGNELSNIITGVAMRTDFTYGAAPDPFTTGVTVTTAGGPVPRLRLRAQ